MYDCPCQSKYFACIQSEPLFQHMPFVSHSLAHATVLSLAPVPWGTLHKDWKAAVRSPQSLPFCRLSKLHSSLSAHRARPPAPTTSVASAKPQFFNIVLVLGGGQNWTQGYKCDLLGAEQRGIITSLDLLAALLFIQTKMLLDIFVARGCGCFMCSLLFTRTSGPFWQGCSPASTTAVFKAWNNCLVYLNTDYKGNGYKKSTKAPIPWCVQRLQPRFCSE